jgi:hypothetical protein
MGTLVSVSTQNVYLGDSTHTVYNDPPEGTGLPRTANTTGGPDYAVYQIFVIDGEGYRYEAAQRLRWIWSKAADLTVNGPVKYAVEKQKLFVLDEDGKEQEMKIVKKILRQPAEPTK